MLRSTFLKILEFYKGAAADAVRYLIKSCSKQFAVNYKPCCFISLRHDHIVRIMTEQFTRYTLSLRLQRPVPTNSELCLPAFPNYNPQCKWVPLLVTPHEHYVNKGRRQMSLKIELGNPCNLSVNYTLTIVNCSRYSIRLLFFKICLLQKYVFVISFLNAVCVF
jgi:hypothetical protein